MLLMLGIILPEHKIQQTVIFIHDRQRIELVLPDQIVCLPERGRGRRGNESFTRRHEVAHLCIHAHPADPVVAARDDAEKLAVRLRVLRNGDRREAVFLLERKYIGQRMLRCQVRRADHKARLVALDPAHHLRLAFDGLRAVNEG